MQLKDAVDRVAGEVFEVRQEAAESGD